MASLGYHPPETIDRIPNEEVANNLKVMGMLRHRPHESHVAVVSLLQDKNGDETLIFIFSFLILAW
jgi:hypothetical protein